MDLIKVEPENTQDEDFAESMVELENALSLCKFGWYQVKLLFATFCAVLAFVMVTATSSYILPVAECDLNMDNRLKGLLIAAPFFGQFVTTIFIGFLIDTFGRRIFMVGGNFCIFVCVLFEGSSQNYWMLLFFKSLQGIAMGVSMSAVTTILSEFVHKEIRDGILLLLGSFMSISLILIACISWAMLPQTHWQLTLWEGAFVIHSWNIYIYVCSLGSLLACIMYYTLPESPKYLLMKYRNMEAIDVLKTIYTCNTGKDRDSFPIKSFKTCKGNKTNMDSKKRLGYNYMFVIKNGFDRRSLIQLILLASISLLSSTTFTSLRLWYPQLSAMIDRYVKDHGNYSQFCDMIIHKGNLEIVEFNATCVPTVSSAESYTNAMLLGLISLIFSGISGFLVNLLGYRFLIFFIQVLTASTSGALYFTSNSLQIALLISFTNALLNTSAVLKNGIVVRVFPTQLRAFSLAIVLLVSRMGALIGNLVFPVLLEMGCMAPFLAITFTSLVQAFTAYFLPDPNKENRATGDS